MKDGVSEFTQKICNYTRIVLILLPTCSWLKSTKQPAKPFSFAKKLLGDKIEVNFQNFNLLSLRVSSEQTSPLSKHPPHFVQV